MPENREKAGGSALTCLRLPVSSPTSEGAIVSIPALARSRSGQVGHSRGDHVGHHFDRKQVDAMVALVNTHMHLVKRDRELKVGESGARPR